jgi:hypothetical protein
MKARLFHSTSWGKMQLGVSIWCWSSTGRVRPQGKQRVESFGGGGWSGIKAEGQRNSGCEEVLSVPLGE